MAQLIAKSALKQINATNLFKILTPQYYKFSTDTNNSNDIVKSVYISQSNDIFSNLALEDWFYRHSNFHHHHLMFLWRNDPCVVIGRHQNPWLEANVNYIQDTGMDLARRNSGGGTVYHDRGNLNITFFSPRGRYNRKQNLSFIARTLNREWNLNVDMNEREDLILDSNYKISGTASKLGNPSAYHHCTLLVNVNKDNLHNVLQINGRSKMETNATRSTNTPTVNLSETHPEITMDRLMERLGWEFMRTSPSNEDVGENLIPKQGGFQLVNPTDEWFPGLAKCRDEFTSWDWKYGKTPKFMIESPIHLAVGLHDLLVRIEVEKGIVKDVTLCIPKGMSCGGLTGEIKLDSIIRGQRFTYGMFDTLEKALKRQGVPFEEYFEDIRASGGM